MLMTGQSLDKCLVRKKLYKVMGKIISCVMPVCVRIRDERIFYEFSYLLHEEGTGSPSPPWNEHAFY
jgi:hypothetical protein